ncbi:hypothetical protein ES703_36382 [subsurface metagenome]
MVNKEDILKELSSQADLVSTTDLAKKVGTTEGSLRSHLSKLKNKGYVEGSTKEGWIITPAGGEAFERGERIPTTPEDVGADTESKLKYYGQLATVLPDTILATNEMILTGDPEDLDHVWKAMTQMDVPIMARRKWWHLWRNYLKAGIPPNLLDKVVGTSEIDEAEGEGTPSTITKEKGRDYVIADDVPVFVGPGLGDYGLKDAKDIIGMRVLRSRFGAGAPAGAGQSGAGQPTSAAEKLSETITALTPFLKQGSDVEMLKEVLSDKLALQRQEILSHIPQQGQPTQPKPFIEQITEFVSTIGSLKEAGPLLRAILGLPEPSSGNPSSAVPVRLEGPDGQPMVLDMPQAINWRKFQNDERRGDERHSALIEMAKTVRENIPDGIQAILATVAEVKGSAGAKTPAPTPAAEQPPVFACGDCKTEFSPPAGWAGQPLKCPNPECGKEYSKEELLA